jgi:hypothetical protein
MEKESLSERILYTWWEEGERKIICAEILAWYTLFFYKAVSFWVSVDYYMHNYSNPQASVNITNDIALQSDYLRAILSCYIRITAFL